MSYNSLRLVRDTFLCLVAFPLALQAAPAKKKTTKPPAAKSSQKTSKKKATPSASKGIKINVGVLGILGQTGKHAAGISAKQTTKAKPATRKPAKRPAARKIVQARPTPKRNKPAARAVTKKAVVAKKKTPAKKAVASKKKAPAKRATPRKKVVSKKKSTPKKTAVVAKKKAPAKRRPTSRPVRRRVVKAKTPFRLSLAVPFNMGSIVNMQPNTNSTHVSTVGEETWFGLTVKQAGLYIIQTKGYSDPYCRLFSNTYLPLAQNDDSGEKRNCRIIYRLKPGRYYLGVLLLPRTRTRFTVSYKKLVPKTLAFGKELAGRLSWPGDMQLYQFQIKQAGNYQIHTTGRSDTVCWLLNPQSAQLQLLAYDDDSGVRKNCALTRQLKPGTHLAVITGSYFGRGPYRVGLKKARQPGVKFKALTFGEPVKDRIYNPKQGHRFRFTLAKDARVTFIAAMSRTSPQMFILDASGNQLYSGGYPSNKRRKMWVFSRMLKAGQYYLDLRASGNPRSSYQLLAQVENQVSLPANKARPLRDGMGKHQDKTPFTQSTFVVALNKNEYNSIEANHPRLLGCYLETDQGELVASAFRGVAKSKRCRLAGMNRTGKFFLRIIARKAISRRRALRRRRRLSYSERRRLRRERFRRLLRRLRRMRRRRRTARNFRRLYQDPPSRRTAKPKARKKPKATIRVAKHKPMILPLVNSFKGATVRFVQTHPQTLPINKSFATKAKGHLVFQVDVPKDDLYWFSGRGTGIKHCALKHVFTGAVKQSNIAEGGCDVAAYLLRGTYMFALQSSRKGNRISWRTYRSMPSIIGTQPIVVGPVKKGQKLSYTVRITKAGYYQLKSTSTSSVPLKLKLELKKGTRTTLRPSSILYKHKLMGYLTPGSYNLRVAVTTGRGAYTLTKSLLPSRTLAANRPLKGQIRKRREKHYYNVNLTSSGWYVFETTGKMDTYCSLYNRSNRRIAYNDDSGVKRNCRIVKQLTAGRYALQIRSILGRVGKYQVKYKKTTALRARRLRRRRRRRRRFGTSGHAAYRRYRYSSGRTTRATIQLNKLYRGVLRNKRDVNLYTVNIRRAGRYIFETKGPLNGSDTKCYMYKGTRRIAYNDDSGYRLHCKIVTRLTPGRYKVKVILALSTRAGPYHFAIRPYGSAWPTSRGRLVARGGTTTRRPVRARPRTRRRGNGNNARRQLLGVIGSRRSRRNRRTKPRGVRGRYRLGTMRRGTTTRRSTKRPPMSRRSPLQIVAGRAMTLRPGLRTQAMTVTQTRIDVYQLAIPRAGTYIIQTHGALDTKCYLDDARGGVLAVNEDSGYTANCRIQLRLPYGTYTLRVLARPVGRMGPYGLSLKLKAD